MYSKKIRIEYQKVKKKNTETKNQSANKQMIGR